MNLQTFYKQAALVFLLIGIASVVDQYIPNFSVPGEPMTWAAFAIACALVVK